MKKLSLFLVAFFCFCGFAIAQKTVTGNITDPSGLPLIGASVIAEGTSTGTISDLDGNFSLEVPAGVQYVIISYTGFDTQKINIADGANFVISLTEGKIIDEVVVSALGVEVDKDKQGSASSTINAGLVSNSNETGALQALSGKTSSLIVSRNSGDPGAGGYIQIRGQNTITGSTQPLIVIDGMPMFNSQVYSESAGDNAAGATGGVVEQSRMNDINPDDIESIEVLKGAAAAALWGSRAANGVIMIKTKSGKGATDKPFDINFKSTYSVDQVNVEHPLQSTYGQGRFGRFEADRGESWGDKIADRPGGADFTFDAPGKYFNAKGEDLYAGYFLDDDGKTKIYGVPSGGSEVFDADGNVLLEKSDNGGKNSKEVYTPSNRDQVFRNGSYWENALSIGGTSGNTNYFVSFSNLAQKGVLAGNSDYKRNTFRVNASNRFTDYLKIGVNVSYSKINSNRVQTGSNLAGLYLGYLRTSPDFDNRLYSGTYYSPGDVPTFGAHRSYRRALGNSAPAYNNPGWTLNKQINTSSVDRYLITPELNFTPVSWLNVTARVGMDNYTDGRLSYFPKYSAGSNSSGSALDVNIAENQLNVDVFARMQRKLSSAISAALTLGYNYNDRKFKRLGGSISGFTIANAPYTTIDNATTQNADPFNFVRHRRSNAGYAELRLDLIDKLFLTVTGRREVASTYPKGVFYPSASLAYQVYENKTGLLNFVKLRASYGTVGIEPPVYVNVTDYIVANTTESWGPFLDGSLYGGTFVRSAVQGNPDLAPEVKTEFEFGGDFRLINNKLTLGATYYQNKTKGAIFAVNVPASTGYSRQWKNAATIENKGMEFDVNYNILRNDNFNWNVFANFSRNKNLVSDLAGVKSIFLNGFTGTSSRAVEGHALGTLWGGKFARKEDGSLDLEENGFPKIAAEEGVLGDPNPDWRGGIGSAIGFKGLNVSFLFETMQGNEMWAGTRGVLNHFGKHPDTAVESVAPSDIPTYGGGVIKAGEKFRGVVKDFGGGPVALDQSWYTSTGGGFGPVAEQFIYDASWTRLREVALSYRFNAPDALKKAFDFVEVGVSGRNLWLLTDFEGQDPESNLTGASNGRGLDYFSNPGTKSYVFTLKFNY